MTSKEAFETLKKYEAELSITNKTEVSYDDVVSARYEISKLVERDTPMQVQIKYSVHKYAYILERQQCPNCSKPIIYSQPNYCGHCGQRLNWRKQND